eukprot:TRINITY_DN9556_c0_g2_i4.p1 TRINITY_DN9556_c0_g2~~TRINITY_DN9556_c0_g2_i4.p1  ORF type:complete len:190 (-),score=32.03 TRINITY_DN9556_c0_g2_i4:156-725(-)
MSGSKPWEMINTELSRPSEELISQSKEIPQTGEIAEPLPQPSHDFYSAPTYTSPMFSPYGSYGFSRFNYMGGNLNFLDKLSQYVYSLCDIAHMLEGNAPGLLQFLSTLKAAIMKVGEYGRTYLSYAVKMAMTRLERVRDAIVKIAVRYLVETNLPAEELQRQIHVFKKIKLLLLIVFALILFRYLLAFL